MLQVLLLYLNKTHGPRKLYGNYRFFNRVRFFILRQYCNPRQYFPRCGVKLIHTRLQSFPHRVQSNLSLQGHYKPQNC